jgi:hypothetical protein
VAEKWTQAGSIKNGFDALLMIAAVIALGALAWILAVLPFRRMAEPTETEQRLALAQYEDRMAHPQFEAIEAHTGCKLPSAYRELFAAQAEWRDRVLCPKGVEGDDDNYEIESLTPADLASLRVHPKLDSPCLCFATGLSSDEDRNEAEYWITLGPADPPVFLNLDEQISQICPHLSEFMAWPEDEI